MKFVIATALAAIVSATPMGENDLEFIRFVSEYGKSYGTKEEFDFRLKTFSANLLKLKAFRSDTSTVGINKFTDRTPEEMKRMNGYRPQDRSAMRNIKVFPKTNATSVDWNAKGAVTPVKDQGACGSCWSFSTTGALEGAHWLKTGQLVSLSEQQLMDCSWKYGNLSCGGGLMDNAFKYAQVTPLTTEANYPYTAMFHTSCSYAGNGIVSVTDYYDVTPNDSDQLKAALALGPVSVAIEADTTVFQGYTGGIITSAACGTTLDHGVLAVGYGVENGVEFILVKNSWGSSWGENGFVRLGVASGAGICGINQSASQPHTN
jgi:C1A family cysteine protease